MVWRRGWRLAPRSAPDWTPRITGPVPGNFRAATVAENAARVMGGLAPGRGRG
jgi:hypothetical protein